MEAIGGMPVSVTLILGGARSGKSYRAQTLAEASGGQVVYVATAAAMPEDAEWTARVARHRLDRPGCWQVIEEPLDVAGVLKNTTARQCILIDCLTLWLTNVMMMQEMDIDGAVQTLCEALRHTSADVICVSNEVGMGLVPNTSLGRAFRDAQGRLNQRIATLADRVELIAAGLPLCLKGER